MKFNFYQQVDKPYFHISYLLEGLFCILSSIIEYYSPNILNNSYKDLIRAYKNDYKALILKMSNILILKCFCLICLTVITLIIFYFMYIFSCSLPKLNFDFKKIASNFILILLIIFIDFATYVFIYPSISGFSFLTSLAVVWNTSQYLLISIICIKICCKIKKRIVFNTILFCLISFYIEQLGFTHYFYSNKTNYENYFTYQYSKIIFLFAPMLFFIKDYSIQKLIKCDVFWVEIIFITWLIEGIIFTILRIIFHPSKQIFFEDTQLADIFYAVLISAKEIIDCVCLFGDLNLFAKGFTQPLGRLFLLIAFFFGLHMAYPISGHTMISMISNGVTLISYLILINYFDRFECSLNLFEYTPSSKELVEENDAIILTNSTQWNKKENYETKTPEDILEDETLTPNDEYINDTNNKFKPYNYEEQIAELEEEILMYKNDKTSLENQLSTIKSENDKLKSQIEKLKNDNEVVENENEELIERIAKLDIEMEQYGNTNS